MQRMSTFTHGIVDYVTSGVIALLPKMMNTSPKVTMLLEGSAGTAAAYSAMTNYELGLVKALPMKAHLALDAISGGMLLGAAMMFDDEDPEVRATLAGLGLFEIAAALTTQTRSGTERARSNGRRSNNGGNGRGNGRGRGNRRRGVVGRYAQMLQQAVS
jgi:hypothetical protein